MKIGFLIFKEVSLTTKFTLSNVPFIEKVENPRSLGELMGLPIWAMAPKTNVKKRNIEYSRSIIICLQLTFRDLDG
jgi:hypothetical protein